MTKNNESHATGQEQDLIAAVNSIHATVLDIQRKIDELHAFISRKESVKQALEEQSSRDTILSKPLEDVFPVYLLNALLNNGINTYGQLVNLTEQQARNLPGVGSRGFRFIEVHLKKKELGFKNPFE